MPSAIEAFATARSFRGAEQLCKALVLPLSGLFTSADWQKTLSAVPGNSQILYAAEIPELLCQLLETADLTDAEVKQHWRTLLEQIAERLGRDKSYADFYGRLRKLSITKGILPPGTDERVDETAAMPPAKEGD